MFRILVCNIIQVSHPSSQSGGTNCSTAKTQTSTTMPVSMYTSKSESKTPTKSPESLASSQNNSHVLFVEDFEYGSCFSP